MSQPGNFSHGGIEHLLSILMRILDFLKLLLDGLTESWEALGMFWPEVLTTIVLFSLLSSAFICAGEFLDRLSAKLNTQEAYLKPRGKVSHSYRTDPKNRNLQHQLIQMLRGDAALAKRLLRQQRQINPGRSDNWYLEKVIYDLERDRRC
jgi:hypothetical protein